MTDPKFMPPPQRRAYLTHLNRCKVMDNYPEYTRQLDDVVLTMPGIKAKRKQLVRKTLMRAKAQGERAAEQRQESPEEYAQTEVRSEERR